MRPTLGVPLALVSRRVLQGLVRQRLVVAVLAVVVGESGVAFHAQQQTPSVFRAEANLVEVIVRVTNKEGRFIPGLTLQDFALQEEGRPQTIVAFNAVDLPRVPIAVADAATPVMNKPVMSTVATNATLDEARVFVVLLDDVSTSPYYSVPARTLVRQFVERYVGPNDLMAAFSTGGRGVQTQEFTTDKTRILEKVDRFIGRRCRDAGILPLPVETEAEKVYNVRVATDVIEALAKHLSSIRGRRITLLWVSEGIDYQILPSGPAPSGTGQMMSTGGANHRDPSTVLWSMREAIDKLRLANVTLYAVDPRQLYAPEDPDMSPLCRGPNRQELIRSLDVLRTFSEETGGFAVINTNDAGPAFERVLDESSQYYVLGYQPASRGRDGEIKRIRVRVIRPGLEGAVVSSRSTYMVSSPASPAPAPPGMGPALAAALTSSFPTVGLPLRVQAVPRRGVDGRGLVHVIVEAAGNELRFAEQNGRFTERLEFGLLTADRLARQGNVQPVAMDLSLSAAQLAQVRLTGVRWLTTLDLAPGHYSLRVAGHALVSKATGAIFLDIDVPKYGDDELRIDGVALTSKPAALTMTSGTSPAVFGLPGPPTTARTFVRGDVVSVSAEVDVPRDFKQGTVQLTVHARSAVQDRPLLARLVGLADRTSAEQPRAFAIDTAGLGAGQFVLRLVVRDQEDRSAETAVLVEVVEQGGAIP